MVVFIVRSLKSIKNQYGHDNPFKILAAETKLKQSEAEVAKLKAELVKLQAKMNQQPQVEAAPKPELDQPEPALV